MIPPWGLIERHSSWYVRPVRWEFIRSFVFPRKFPPFPRDAEWRTRLRTARPRQPSSASTENRNAGLSWVGKKFNTIRIFTRHRKHANKSGPRITIPSLNFLLSSVYTSESQMHGQELLMSWSPLDNPLESPLDKPSPTLLYYISS